MRLLFVADGPRDEATVPAIVGQLLQTQVEVTFREWKKVRLDRGGGYTRKLRFALLQARDQVLDGVVATVDCDRAKQRERLALLQAARDDDRRALDVAPIPAALGEAVPHVEAWLLDDEKAVREALNFPSDKSIQSVQDVDPKTYFNELIDECSRNDGALQCLSAIAECLSLGRCNHAASTGLSDFAKDVEAELKCLAPRG